MGKSHECRSAWHMLVDYYYASPVSRFRRGFNRLCFDTTQLFEDVLCRTALPQSNLHASSPSKSTTASFISTNLTIHSSQSSLFAVRKYLSPVSPVIRDPSSHCSNRSPTLGSQREQIQRTRPHYTLYVRDRLPRSRPLAHEQQRNSSLQVTLWCTSSPCGHGKPTFLLPLS